MNMGRFNLPQKTLFLSLVLLALQFGQESEQTEFNELNVPQILAIETFSSQKENESATPARGRNIASPSTEDLTNDSDSL